MLPQTSQTALLLLTLIIASASGEHFTDVAGVSMDFESSRRTLFPVEELNEVAHATGSLVGQFCVAEQNANLTDLQNGLNWACSASGGAADCSEIQPGQPCYKENNLVWLASYAYNQYYHQAVGNGGSCSFGGTATTTTTDPSSGSCIFAGSLMQNGSTTATPPTTFLGLPPPPPPPSSFSPSNAGHVLGNNSPFSVLTLWASLLLLVMMTLLCEF